MITGASGIVGKELAHQLKKNEKYKIFLLSNSKIKIKNKKDKFTVLKQDLTKPLVFNLKMDTIVHCASKNPLSNTDRKMKTIYQKNIKMTKNLIEFANKTNVKKIIFLSSMDIYGSVHKKIVFESQKKIKPSLYGKSKFLSEKLFCNRKNKFKAVCLRIPGVFTVNISRKRQPLIVNILKKILKNENIDIYNFNKHFNNIIDPQEIAKFINKAIKIDLNRSDYYNFCASRPIKFINVVNLIKKIFKSNSKIMVKNSKKNSFIISNSKIKNYFNFKISTTKNIILRNCRKIKNTNYKVA